MAAADGTTTVVATPHCSPHFPTAPETVDAGLGEMRSALAAEGIPIELRRGAEIALEMAQRLPDDALRQLTLGGSRCVLLECPLAPAVGTAFERCVEDLQRRGYRVLLAHPERAPAFMGDPQRLRGLVEAGALCSITAGSLSGDFGRGPRSFSLELLRDGLVHSVDSDAHHAEGRPPGLRAGLAAAEEALGDLAGRARWLTTELPAALLADAPLPAAP